MRFCLPFFPSISLASATAAQSSFAQSKCTIAVREQQAIGLEENSADKDSDNGSREIDKLTCILNALLKKVQELRACTEGYQVRNKHVSNFVAYPTKRRSQKHKILHMMNTSNAFACEAIRCSKVSKSF